MKYEVNAIDSQTYTPATGLSPVWSALKKSADNSDYTPQPAITEQSEGLYVFTISPAERLIGRIDLGASLLAQDRYVEGVVLDPADSYLDVSVLSRAAQVSVDAIPTTPVLTAHFDAIVGTPDVSVSADIAAVFAAVGTVLSDVVSLAAKFTGITSAANWLRGLSRKDTMDATAKTEINSGGGTYNEATDSLEAIADEEAVLDTHIQDMVSALGGKLIMNGSNAITLLVEKTSTTIPIQNVYINVYNSTETVLLGVAVTNAAGKTLDANNADLVNLDPDPLGFVLHLRKNGFVFATTTMTNAELLAGGTKTIYGDVFVPAPPPAAELQTLFMYVVVLDFDPSTGVTVTANLSVEDQIVNGAFIQGIKTADLVDGSGWAQLFLPIGADVTISIPQSGDYRITVSSDATRNLASYFS